MYIVGKVLKPKGIKGEVKTEIITSFPEHLNTIDTFYVETHDGWQACNVEKVKLAGRFAHIKFLEIEDRNEAEKLRNQYLYIPEEELQTLDEDEYYVHDLIGLRVVDEEDRFLGTIVDVETYANHDVYVMEDEQKVSLMIPAVKDFIIKIDLPAKRVVIRKVEGLLD